MSIVLGSVSTTVLLDKEMLSDHERLAEAIADADLFEKSAGIDDPRNVDAHGVITYSDRLVQLTWVSWQAASRLCALRMIELHQHHVSVQAKLAQDNVAFACNLKGKAATTGATYSHLARQVEDLTQQLAMARSEPVQA